MAPRAPKRNLANATPESLIDEIGALAAQRKAIEKEEKFLKEALKARVKSLDMYEQEITGETYYGTVTKSTQDRIKSELVREKFEELDLDIEEVISVIEITTCRTAKIGEKLPTESSWGS